MRCLCCDWDTSLSCYERLGLCDQCGREIAREARYNPWHLGVEVTQVVQDVLLSWTAGARDWFRERALHQTVEKFKKK